jgi:hypothetical protein
MSDAVKRHVREESVGSRAGWSRRLALLSLLSLTPALPATALAAPVATPAWETGFETGFPGEFLNYDDGSFTASGTPNSGKNEAWTIVDESDPLVFAGSHAYKGWPVNSQSESHRCYPSLHVEIESPLVNSFMVYVDVDYDNMTTPEWVHLATWANNPDWAVFTLSIRDRKLEMAHLDWQYIGPTPMPEFPLRRWVRMTAYIHFRGEEAYTRIWQDGVPILEGIFTDRPGTSLMRAHWGWYSSGSISSGSQYNDSIQIWKLSEPLTDLEEEPASPYDDGGIVAPGTGGSSGAPAQGGAAATTGGAASTTGGRGTTPSQGGAAGGSVARGGSTSTGGRSGGNATGGRSAGGNAAATAGANASSSGGRAATGGSPPISGGGRVATSSGGSVSSTGGDSNDFEPAKISDSDSGCTFRHGCEHPGKWAALTLLLGAAWARRRSRRASGARSG